MAGWTATSLRWEGVSFATLYRTLVEPALPSGTSATHLVFRGLDGYRSAATIEDALAEDVLVAENLDGRPLDSDHGAPARLVSPSQYGFVSTKHLCGIEVHATEPTGVYRSPALRLLAPHPRARVWHQERHRHIPAWLLRLPYRALIAPITYLSARGGQDREPV